MCVVDSCGCDEGGDRKCFCTIVAAFARECALKGECVRWRSRDLCPTMCDNGKVYQECAEPCKKTCSNFALQPEPFCNWADRADGCFCPKDLVENENGVCVPLAQCPCSYSNGPGSAVAMFPAGITIDVDCQKCICLDSTFVCDGNLCPPCLVDQFTCSSGDKCIAKSELCDGTFGCPDKSDEHPLNPNCDSGIPSTDYETTTLTIPTHSTPVPFCNDYADIAFVVDVSGSIEGDGENPGYFDRYVKSFLKNFARKLHIGSEKIQIGLVTFGNEGKLEFPLKNTTDEVIAGIDNIRYNPFGENTNTSGGIKVMRSEVLGGQSPNYRQQATHVAIIVTDGKSTYDKNQTIMSANEAKKNGIIILAIGVTLGVDMSELLDIASETTIYNSTGLENATAKGIFVSNGLFTYIPTITELNGIVSRLMAILSEGICVNGGESIDKILNNWNWSCDFELDDGSADWCGLNQATDDHFNWTILHGLTPSDPTGPDQAFNGNYYIYIEASNPRQLNDSAKIYIPSPALPGNYCLAFHYHMFGIHIGELHVVRETTGEAEPETIWRKTKEQGNRWLFAQLTVNIDSHQKIGFVGLRGDEYSGDIGLDALSLKSNECQ